MYDCAVVNICFFADAFNSNATYEENVCVRKSFFDLIEDFVNDLSLFVPDLDVEGNFDIQPFDADEITRVWCMANLHPTNDGSILRDKLREFCQSKGFDIDKEIAETLEYEKSLISQKTVRVTYSIPVSKKAELDAFVKSLLEEEG